MIVGLEGGVAAGKITLRGKLTALGHDGLKEYMDFVDSSIHPLISDWPILFKTRFFLEIERARARQLPPDQAFIDRTYLTLLAHDFARDDPRRFSKGYEKIYLRFAGSTIHPDKLVFLDASHDSRTPRAASRGIPMAGYFTTAEFNSRLRTFFEALCEDFPILILDTDHLSPDEVLGRVLDFSNHHARSVGQSDLLLQALKVSRKP